MVNSPFNKVVIGGQVKMLANGAIKYKSFSKQNEKMMVTGDFVISMGTETIETLGTNYPTPGLTIKRRYTNIWQKQNGN